MIAKSPIFLIDKYKDD